MKLDLAKSMELLDKAGYAAEDGHITLATIGRRYHIPPQLVYETIKSAHITTAKKSDNKNLPRCDHRKHARTSTKSWWPARKAACKPAQTHR